MSYQRIALPLFLLLLSASLVLCMAHAEEPTPPADQPLKLEALEHLGIKMVRIEPGSFEMGWAAGRPDEKPLNKVTISRPFLMAVMEVTQGQWKAVMGTDSAPARFKGDDLPVESLTWLEAMEFCRRLTINERLAGRTVEGYEYRLPTEAEWEYAAKAGGTDERYGQLGDIAWFEENSGKATHPGGRRAANAWGLFDMLGNVQEWCLDEYKNTFYLPSGARVDPLNLPTGDQGVARGGGWSHRLDLVRASSRAKVKRDQKLDTTGLRIVLAPECPAAIPSPLQLDPRVSAAVEAGVDWLARAQEPDGHWDGTKWGGLRESNFDKGITGLARMALISAGQTRVYGRHRACVDKAIKWLCAGMDQKGNIAPGLMMYHHAIPLVALLDASGEIPADDATAATVKRALGYMLDCQNKGKAWRYWPRDGQSDISVTAWCVMALDRARDAKLEVPKEAWDGVSAFLESVTDPKTGVVGYAEPPTTEHPLPPYQVYSMAACAANIKMALGIEKKDKHMPQLKGLVMQNLPTDKHEGLDEPFFYYWFHATHAIHAMGGKDWDKWRKQLHEVVLPMQDQDADPKLKGSWPHERMHHFGNAGGDVVSTAFAVLTLAEEAERD